MIAECVKSRKMDNIYNVGKHSSSYIALVLI